MWGSHNVTWYPTQVNAPCLKPSQRPVARHSIYVHRPTHLRTTERHLPYEVHVVLPDNRYRWTCPAFNLVRQTGGSVHIYVSTHLRAFRSVTCHMESALCISLWYDFSEKIGTFIHGYLACNVTISKVSNIRGGCVRWQFVCWALELAKKFKDVNSSLGVNNRRATELRLPHVMTQCYLPPNAG